MAFFLHLIDYIVMVEQADGIAAIYSGIFAKLRKDVTAIANARRVSPICHREKSNNSKETRKSLSTTDPL